MQYFVVTVIFLFAAGVISVGVGTFILMIAGAKDINMNLKSIHERGVFAENLLWTLSQLSDFIQHNAILKLLCVYYTFSFKMLIFSVSFCTLD